MSIGMMKWSELPDDLLRRISEKLAISDWIRFSAVCSGWRSGSAKIPQLHANPNRQPPLLITFPSSSPSTAHLHSPLSPEPSADPIPVPIPDPPVGLPRCIIGSSHGWLITAVDGSIQLLNPLTGSHIDIPLRDDEDGADFLGGGDPRDIFFAGAALTSNPSRTNNYCLVLQPLGLNYRFVLFQSPSNTWRAVPGIAAAYADFVCQDGYVHAATCWGQVDAWIVTPASLYEEMRFPGWIGMAVSRSQSLTHLVRTSASRELLQVWQEEGGSTKVYKMDCRDLSLSEVRSLGDRALLLGKNLSVSVSTVDVPQLRRDCVYYLCDNVDSEGRLRFKICDLSNGVIEEDGFFPVDVGPRINSEPPFWITPSYP